MKKCEGITIYRFHDWAAINLFNDDTSRTHYLDKEQAKNLSIELLILSKEINEVGFVDSVYGEEHF